MFSSGITLNSALDVFIFIITFSIYVCSILWIYGDAATRGLAGWKGAFLPLLFIVTGLIAFSGYLYALIIWPLGYIGWLLKRPMPVKLEF